MKIGYARVSTDEQNLALQVDALKAAGCERIIEETASGAKKDRQGLADALASCAAGDVLTVWKLDRLSRSLAQLVLMVDDLKARGVDLQALHENLDTTTSGGRYMFGTFANLAQFERDMIRDRTKAGMQAAKRRGKHVGRPVKLPPERLDLAAQLRASGQTWRQVAALVGVSTSTLRDSLKRRATDLQTRLNRSTRTPLEEFLSVEDPS